MSVRVYWLDCRTVEPDSERVQALMSFSRLEKLRKITAGHGRQQSAAAELALAMAMAQERVRSGVDTALRLQAVQWRPLPGGKPVVDDGLHFCLAHAGHMAVCAVSDAPVGVDVEPAARVVSQGMRRKILSPVEQNRPDADLLWTWVAKESYIKLTGEGLRRSMAGFSAAEGEILDHTGNRLACVRTVPTEWSDYTLCVCTKQPQPIAVQRLIWN